MNKICVGCLTQNCIISHNSTKRTKICPCRECMIKSICTEQCNSFRKLVIGLFPMVYIDYKAAKIISVMCRTEVQDKNENCVALTYSIGAQIEVLNDSIGYKTGRIIKYTPRNCLDDHYYIKKEHRYYAM